MPASQIKVPAQIKGAVGGSSGGSTPTGTGFRRVTSGVEDPTATALSAAEIAAALDAGSGTAAEVVRGDGSISALGATDIPTGVDATKLADGSVTNAELQRINSVTSNVQDQIDGKAATSHNHNASAINAGTLALARGGLNADISATGGATHFLSQGADHSVAARALVASDIPSLSATYLALAGGSMAAAISFSANGYFADGWAICRSNYGMLLSNVAGKSTTNYGASTTVGTSATTVGRVSGVNFATFEINSNNYKSAKLHWDGSTLSWLSGNSKIVASSSPAPDELGIDISAGDIRAKCGSGTASVTVPQMSYS